MITFEIHQLDEDDWENYKDIRLHSLQDSPDSFGSTYEREVQFSEQQWQSRLRSTQPTTQSMLWVAAIDTNLLGLLSMVHHASDAGKASLYQMWVAPDHRNKGAGTALINSAIQSATAMGIEKLELSVTTTNTDAVSLYKKLGFVETGFTEPLRQGSSLESLTMTLELNAR